MGLTCVRVPYWRLRIAAMPAEPKASVAIVVLCTPNYDGVGKPALATIHRYALRHGYHLYVYREKMAPGAAHYSKVAMARAAVKRFRQTHDYVVVADADTVVMRDDVTIPQIVKTSSDPAAAIHMAKDFYSGSSGRRCGIVITKHNTGWYVIDLKRADAAEAVLHRWDALNWDRAANPNLMPLDLRGYKDQGTFELLRRQGHLRGVVGAIRSELCGTEISLLWRQSWHDKENSVRKLWEEVGSPPLPALPRSGVSRLA